MSQARESFFRCHGISPGIRFERSINLDGLTESELKIAAGALELDLAVRAIAALALKARKLRLSGNIAQAVEIESLCDHKITQLPANLRW